MVAAFGANLAISVAKFVAAGLTGSVAMLSEGFHSLADTGNQGMLLYGMKAARRPADDAHPFGRGKEAYFWSFMVAVVLFAGGAVLAVQHGINALREPHQVENLTPSFIVLIVSLMIEAVSFTVAMREFSHVRDGRRMWRALRESKDASLVVVLLEDTAAMAGLLVALVGTTLVAVTGDTIWDGVASLVIGVILGLVAVFLAIETKALLIGEAASRDDRASVRARLMAMPEVESVGRLLTMQLGSDEMLINVEVDFDDALSAAAVEEAIFRAEQHIQAVLPEARHVFVEHRARQRG